MEIQNFLIFVYGTFFAGITTIALIYQMRRQAKTTSAQLSLEMVKRMREKDFVDVVDIIWEEKSKECNQIDLEKMLNHLEYMAAFEYDDLLESSHIRLMYGGLLDRIRKDRHLQKYIKNEVDKNPKTFEHLRALYSKI